MDTIAFTVVASINNHLMETKKLFVIERTSWRKTQNKYEIFADQKHYGRTGQQRDGPTDREHTHV